MTLENLELWQGAWTIKTQHYHGKLIINDVLDDTEEGILRGTLILKKGEHDKLFYNFGVSIALDRVDSDKIVFTGRDQRSLDERSYSIFVLLVRYTQPKGVGNRAIGYFQLEDGPDQAEGHKQPIEATKD